MRTNHRRLKKKTGEVGSKKGRGIYSIGGRRGGPLMEEGGGQKKTTKKHATEGGVGFSLVGNAHREESFTSCMPQQAVDNANQRPYRREGQWEGERAPGPVYQRKIKAWVSPERETHTSMLRTWGWGKSNPEGKQKQG